MLNATFNNISVISWRSDLLLEEAGVPEENHEPAASHWQTLSHNAVSSTPRLSGMQVKGGNDTTAGLSEIVLPHVKRWHNGIIIFHRKYSLILFLWLWCLTPLTNNISALSWRSFWLVWGNRGTHSTQPTCRKSLTNVIT